MIVGKAIYEGILLKASFARFFLNRFGDNPGTITGGTRNTIDDLQALDPELYKNLMMVKYYDGNVEDLGLTFAIEEDYLGRMISLPLVKNG